MSAARQWRRDRKTLLWLMSLSFEGQREFALDQRVLERHPFLDMLINGRRFDPQLDKRRVQDDGEAELFHRATYIHVKGMICKRAHFIFECTPGPYEEQL